MSIPTFPVTLTLLFCISAYNVSCSITSVDDGDQGLIDAVGSVYGKVGIQGREFDMESVKVIIDETDLVAEVDENGIFYFPNINPGTYTIRARLDNYADDILENVEINKDSLTFIPSFFLRISSTAIRSTWEGAKIKRVTLEDLGCIEGQVTSSAIPITNAIVHIPGTFWLVRTDDNGRYNLKVLIGQYDARSFKAADPSNEHGFHPTQFLNVIVNREKSSLVNFELRPGIFREIPRPIEWDPVYIETGC